MAPNSLFVTSRMILLQIADLPKQPHPSLPPDNNITILENGRGGPRTTVINNYLKNLAKRMYCTISPQNILFETSRMPHEHILRIYIDMMDVVSVSVVQGPLLMSPPCVW